MLFGLAYGKAGLTDILLIAPYLGLALCLLQLAESFQLHRIGTYIRDEIWPLLYERTGYKPSWEDAHHFASSRREHVAAAMLTDGVVPALLIGAGIFALASASPDTFSLAWWGGVAALLLTGAAPVVYGLMVKGMHIIDSTGTGGRAQPESESPCRLSPATTASPCESSPEA